MDEAAIVADAPGRPSREMAAVSVPPHRLAEACELIDRVGTGPRIAEEVAVVADLRQVAWEARLALRA